MSKFLKCKCGSTNIKNLEPEKIKIYETYTTIMKFLCESCGNKFEKNILTLYGIKNFIYNL